MYRLRQTDLRLRWPPCRGVHPLHTFTRWPLRTACKWCSCRQRTAYAYAANYTQSLLAFKSATWTQHPAQYAGARRSSDQHQVKGDLAAEPKLFVVCLVYGKWSRGPDSRICVAYVFCFDALICERVNTAAECACALRALRSRDQRAEQRDMSSHNVSGSKHVHCTDRTQTYMATDFVFCCSMSTDHQ